MKLSEIIEAVKDGAEQDMSIPDASIIRWVNMGIDRINTAIETNIPYMTAAQTEQEPGFDKRYHEALVTFGINKYRESDGDYNAAQYFLGQFDAFLVDMQRDMVIPPSLKNDYNHQQIVVTDATVTNYSLTMPSGSYFDKVVIYRNDVEMNPLDYRINFSTRSVIFKVALTVNDKITVKFENNSDLNSPPYEWWGQSGW